MKPNRTDEQLASAIFSVNRHAKTATDNKYLYELKRLTIEKMIETGRAKKLGLHFVENPRFSQQQSSVLVQCADYYFHLLPKKEDFQSLTHLGHLDENYRNPQRRMSLNLAKQLLSEYTGLHQSNLKNKPTQMPFSQSNKKPVKKRSYIFGSTYLD
ncbi:YkyB family protein [Paenisporosarcina sp. TG20]|uniref:YkyB family protein n=1 Tax=Paenisporosarcina sp. TG20 TaxID=1211706 RepID=UPI0002E94FB8|nr:YkyB family protein [Paenisporosarcina sp. TG20]